MSRRRLGAQKPKHAEDMERLQEKGSRFQAFVFPIESREDDFECTRSPAVRYRKAKFAGTYLRSSTGDREISSLEDQMFSQR